MYCLTATVTAEQKELVKAERAEFVSMLKMTNPGSKKLIKSKALAKLMSQAAKDRSVCMRYIDMQCNVDHAMESLDAGGATSVVLLNMNVSYDY